MTKLTIVGLRQRLPLGAEFTCERCGPAAALVPPELVRTRRRVLANSHHQLTTLVLDGPGAGHHVDLKWAGLRAHDQDDAILVAEARGGAHLRITDLVADPQAPASEAGRRIRHAEAALAAYNLARGATGATSDVEVGDLVADLFHLADANNCNVYDIVRRALRDFEIDEEDE